MEMHKYPSTNQFRQTVKDAPKEVITFTGTVKLHGTNASVVLDKDGNMYCQSRKNVITPEQDNAGFATFVHKNKDTFQGILAKFANIAKLDFEYISIYGEWCGKGIQKGVAINELDKMYVIFAVKYKRDGIGHWLDISDKSFLSQKDLNIHNIFDFPTYSIDIDFNYPQLSQTKLAEITEEVEKECPVGKAFGVSGIGEGVVWFNLEHHLKFKVKGEKHSVTKVKTLAPVDTVKIESILKFIEYAVTDNRLEQGISEVTPDFDIKKMGDFIRWVYNDVVKEELDTMIDNGIEPKEIGKYVSNKARKWFMDNQPL